MTLGEHQRLFLKDTLALMHFALDSGYELTYGEVQRPIEMQELYVKTGRSKTMNSMHLKRCAIDLNIFKDGKLCNREQIEPLGKLWEGLSPENRWGGSWRGLIEEKKSSFVDAPHFERQC